MRDFEGILNMKYIKQACFDSKRIYNQSFFFLQKTCAPKTCPFFSPPVVSVEGPTIPCWLGVEFLCFHEIVKITPEH